MNQFGRVVLGYHGCPLAKTDSVEFLRGLVAGTNKVADWKPSSNEYDWLGGGIYFWEYGPARARQWAQQDGFVVGALIQLGRCFDLTDPGFEPVLKTTYDQVLQSYEQQDKPLPDNQRQNGMMRQLDRLILDQAMSFADASVPESDQNNVAYQTVRCAFEEGKEAFPGSMLRTQTHIQLAVRDLGCILGVFRPTFDV